MGDPRARSALWLSVLVTVGLYLVPGGRYLGYPLILFSTAVHELGHGVTAALLGGRFALLEIYPDASGVAHWAGAVSPAGRAAVAAGGLLGPAVVAAMAFVAARGRVGARVFLLLLAAGLLGAVALVVRAPFGIVFFLLAAAALAAPALLRRGEWAQLTLAFVAVQLALTVFSRGDYLFVAEATTGAGTMPSDVQQVATGLGGPYWLWGALIGAASVMVLGLGLWASAWPRRPGGRAGSGQEGSALSRLRRKHSATPSTNRPLMRSPKRV